jgi:hypothetical protein
MAGMKPKAICHACFIGILLLGIACAIGGPLFDEAVRAARLDATLTPQELRDDALRARTRDLIDRTGRRYWPIWVSIGGALVVVSVIGLRATAQLRENPN